MACYGDSFTFFYTLRRNSKVPPNRRLFQEPHGVTSQKTFFIVIAVKTSNLTLLLIWFRPPVTTELVCVVTAPQYGDENLRECEDQR
jgi:hypothetical protein